MRTPTGCCGSTSLRAPTSALIAPTRSPPWRPPSMRGHAKLSTGERPLRRLTSCCSQPRNNALRRPLESAEEALAEKLQANLVAEKLLHLPQTQFVGLRPVTP